MEVLIYIALLLPAVLMIIAGVLISTMRKDNTMTNHHFARNFNIKKYSKKIITLFTIFGIMFSVCGLIIYKVSIVIGFVLLLVSLGAFIAGFVVINKKY